MLCSSVPFESEFQELASHVRKGTYVDSPSLITRYLDLGEEIASAKASYEQLEIHRGIFDNLLEAICDHCVAEHWRQTCLDYCYRPLSNMQRFMHGHSDRYYMQQQYNKLRTLSHYFC